MANNPAYVNGNIAVAFALQAIVIICYNDNYIVSYYKINMALIDMAN